MIYNFHQTHNSKHWCYVNKESDGICRLDGNKDGEYKSKRGGK